MSELFFLIIGRVTTITVMIPFFFFFLFPSFLLPFLIQFGFISIFFLFLFELFIGSVLNYGGLQVIDSMNVEVVYTFISWHAPYTR